MSELEWLFNKMLVKKWHMLPLMCVALGHITTAQASNPSQSTQDRVDKSVTIANSNTWQQIAKPDAQRGAMQCENVGSHNQGLYVNSYANGNTAPTPTGIGSAGVLTIYPGGAYEPQGGFIFGGAVWVIGTASDVMTCWFGATQP